jgi:phage baseplate assembly protein W
MSTYLNIKFPLRDSEAGYLFEDDKTTFLSIKSNLTFLLTSNVGDWIYRPKWGSDLRKYLFDQFDNITQQEIEESIRLKVSENLPDVTIRNMTFERESTNSSALNVKIDFSYQEGVLSRNDSITLQF